MPRTGVTYEDVLQSIKVLEKAGLNASIRNIRERIGRGSLTTIAEHKREYEIATAKTPREAVPDPIAKGLLSGAEVYWQELIEAAEAEIAKIQEESDATVSELTNRVSELEAVLADAQEALNGESLAKKTVEDKLTAADSERSDLESQLRTKSIETSALLARLDEAHQAGERANSERIELGMQLKDAQVELARLLERSDNIASRHAAELARMNAALADASANNDTLTEQLDSARTAAGEATDVAHELQARAESAEKEHNEVQAIVEALRNDVKQQQDSQKEMRASLEAQLAAQVALVKGKDAHIDDLQSANSALKKALRSRKKKKAKKKNQAT